MSTIFVAGVYGVGKSTVCTKLSQVMGMPFYSAGDLISRKNGESYGANKLVADKDANQNILVSEVKRLSEKNNSIILAGHFCILGEKDRIIELQEQVFFQLKIEKIILLEADSSKISVLLKQRDHKEYTHELLEEFLHKEHQKAEEMAGKLACSYYVHKMHYSDLDVQEMQSFLYQESV